MSGCDVECAILELVYCSKRSSIVEAEIFTNGESMLIRAYRPSAVIDAYLEENN
jgi:hypothetical protein